MSLDLLLEKLRSYHEPQQVVAGDTCHPKAGPRPAAPWRQRSARVIGRAGGASRENPFIKRNDDSKIRSLGGSI